MITTLETIYKDYPVKPYISPNRDVEAWLLNPKPVPKLNMELLENNLLAGDIILIWRINFGTFTTFSKMKVSDLNQALHDHFS